MSASATSVLEAPDLQLPDFPLPELIYLVDRDTQVLGTAPADDWPRFEARESDLRFEIDTPGNAHAVLNQEGAQLVEVRTKHWLKVGDIFVLKP